MQDSYPALFILRCLQSSNSSGTMALASGVVADIATAAERGKWMGFTYAGSVLGPAVGPLLGGILAEFLGWRAIFWFLVILASANRNPAEEQDAPSKSFVFSFHYPRQGKRPPSLLQRLPIRGILRHHSHNSLPICRSLPL